MRRNVLSKAKKGLLAVLLATGVVGCSSIGRDVGAPPDPQQQVKELAAGRWKALVAGDLAKAYEYLSPGTREAMSLEAYKKRLNPAGWKKAEVVSVACEQERCDAVIMLEYSFGELKSIQTRLDEVWLEEGGKWWHVPRK